jgi:hypothetical protein
MADEREVKTKKLMASQAQIHFKKLLSKWANRNGHKNKITFRL